MNGKEYAFVGRPGSNCIITSVGAFFANLLMTAADMPARCTEIGCTATTAFGVTGIIAALVSTLGLKIVTGDAANGPAPGTSSDKRVVIDREKTIALAIGASGFWLRRNAAPILAVVIDEASCAIWVDINEWIS